MQLGEGKTVPDKDPDLIRTVVLCCSKRKKPSGTFCRDGRRICFCADPSLAPADPRVRHVHPDDVDELSGQTWRDLVVAYNDGTLASHLAPRGTLLEAGRLYADAVYDRAYRLNKKWGPRLPYYILSGGWGLIRASFKLPDYNVTFSREAAKKDPHALRKPQHRFKDINHLVEDLDSGELSHDEIHLFAGRAYVDYFLSLVSAGSGVRVVHHWHTVKDKKVPGVIYVPFHGDRQMNFFRDALSQCLHWFERTEPE